jgi:hypothetical protein
MAFSFSPRIVTDGLVLYLDAANQYSYPGAGTTWSDISRSGNNGVLTNGPTYNSANGGSIVLDGTNDFVVATSVRNLQNLNSNFTINVFTKPSVASYGNIIVLADTGYANECQLVLNSTTIYVTKYGGTQLISGGSISPNVWYNITYVQNNSVGFLYINGNLIQSNAITPQTSAISNIILGSYNTSGPQPYGGNIAIAQIYNRALSAAEILQNYNATKTRFGL